MLSKYFVNLVIQSTREAIREPELFKKIEHTYVNFRGNYFDLENPINFDRYSFLFFKSIALHVSDDEEKNELTKLVGKEIYNHIKKDLGLSPGESNDFKKIKTNLKKVLEYFTNNGYVDNVQIIWDNFDMKKWAKDGKASFELIMNNPVIFSSAKRLHQEEGFAQHYLSRTVEAALKDFKVYGKETKGFDPTKFSSDKVIERWELVKC